MPSQSGEFAQGTFGFPLRIKLDKLSADDIASIESVDVTFKRPDGTNFEFAATPQDIIDGSINYIFADGDLSLGGGYRYKAIFHMTNGRTLTGGGSFQVKRLIST
jgi:hypothetical protein